MSRLRETIELLTKLLRGNGTSKIKAEIFRLAKFNDDEATVPFWKMLFELLYFLKYGVIDDVTVKAYAELTAEELVVYVKQSMQCRGFYSKEFSNLPNDMSRGSRELLLAFAWLLCKEGVIDKFMDGCTSSIDENSISVYEFELSDSSKPSNRYLPRRPLTPAQRVQHLQMLNGKMRGSLKTLYALQREKFRLDHRVHESTTDVSLSPDRNHLSAMEVHMLKHPELLKKVLHLLEKDNERLQNLLLWRDQEENFWKWMESVLDLKIKDLSSRGDHSQSCLIHYNIPPDSVSKMDGARKQLEEAILKYESIIEQLEEVWESKRGRITEQELDNLLASINMEITLQRANLALDSTETMLHSYKTPSLSYVKNTTNSSSKKLSNLQASTNRMPPQGSSGILSQGAAGASGQGDGPDTIGDLRSDILLLESRLKQLELESKKQRTRYTEELDAISASIPDTICIQPKGCR